MASSHRDVFKKKTRKIPTQYLDADGKPVNIEVRDDEEQQIKYQQIISTLVAAGYFRARIIGLSPFDMVVGGLTWCIDTSEIDIDVDLLFEEGLTIGQKIALTEKIVAVLPKIKCPYFIEPHQIQGLDFIHILPVIQWLVKWSTENRQRKAEYLKSYAINQFHKRYPLADNEHIRTKTKLFGNIQSVIEKYKGGSSCRFDHDLSQRFSNEADRVESTLYQYGQSSVQRIVVRDEIEADHSILESPLQMLLKNSSRPVMAGGNIKVKQQILTRIVNSNLEADESDETDENSDLNIEVKPAGQILIEEIKILEQKKEHVEDAITNVLKETDELEERLQRCQINKEKFSEAELSALEELKSLLLEHEELKKSETKFKEDCKEEMIILQDEIMELEESDKNTTETDELEAHIKELETKLQSMKLELGKITRETFMKERYLDQIPTRAELAQYQKRFVELYNQIAAKHKETKQYYSLFNTYSDKCQYLRKVHTLVNSIYDNYDKALTSSSRAKEEFKSQLRTIKSGVEQTSFKLMQKRNDLRRTKEKLSSQIEFLQEQRRRYASAVKEFSVLCKQNEQLIAEIHDMSTEAGYPDEGGDAAATSIGEDHVSQSTD